MTDIKRIQKITETIEETSKIGLKFFSDEFGKFINNLEDAVKTFNDEAVKVKKELYQSIKQLEEFEEKVEKLKEEHEASRKKIESLNLKEIELREQEENLLQLHNTLAKKEKILYAKEREVLNKIKTSQEKIVRPKL